MEYPGLIGPAYQSAAVLADNEVCQNWYAEQTESSTAAAAAALLPTQGVLPDSVVGAPAPTRALFTNNGRTFTVAGAGFYERIVAASGAVSTTRWGMVLLDGNPATICSNGAPGHQVFVTSGGQGYLFDLISSAFTTVVASQCSQGAYLDGFFLYLNPITSTLWVSALLDGTTWPALQFAVRLTAPDPWVALLVVDRLIFLLGQQTSDVYWNQGTAPMPFGPIQEAFMEQGIVAPYSLARIGASCCWLSQSEQGRATVVQTSGYTPGRISTHAVETRLDSGVIADAVADSFEQRGHQHYCLSLPTLNQTWVYDAKSTWWHQRATTVPRTGVTGRWRPTYFASLASTLLCGDSQTGALGVVSSTTGTEIDGAAIQRVRQGPRYAADQKLVTVHRFQLLIDAGVGLETGLGQTPQLMLRTSMTGGETWGSERWQTAGPIGAYSTRVVWHQLGQGRNFVPRIATSDPVPFRLTSATFAPTVGAF